MLNNTVIHLSSTGKLLCIHLFEFIMVLNTQVLCTNLFPTGSATLVFAPWPTHRTAFYIVTCIYNIIVVTCLSFGFVVIVILYYIAVAAVVFCSIKDFHMRQMSLVHNS